MKYIKSLSTVKQNELELVGFRAKDIALLKEQKFLVPEAFVITSNAFDTLMEKNNLKYKIDYILKHVSPGSPQTYVNAWTSVRRALKAAQLPHKMPTELKEMYEGLAKEGIGLDNGKQRPVRMILSTNLVSDSENNDSIIQNINGWEEFKIALRETWSLAYNPTLLKPRMDSKFPEGELKIAVIVQAMDTPESCCNAYSCLPTDRHKIYLQTYHGYTDLRDKVVKDFFALSKEGLSIITSEVREQPEILKMDSLGELSLVHYNGKTIHDKLIDRDVQELARQVKKAERTLQTPVKAFFSTSKEQHSLLWVNRLGIPLEKEEPEKEEEKYLEIKIDEGVTTIDGEEEEYIEIDIDEISEEEEEKIETEAEEEVQEKATEEPEKEEDTEEEETTDEETEKEEEPEEETTEEPEEATEEEEPEDTEKQEEETTEEELEEEKVETETEDTEELEKEEEEEEEESETEDDEESIESTGTLMDSSFKLAKNIMIDKYKQAIGSDVPDDLQEVIEELNDANSFSRKLDSDILMKLENSEEILGQDIEKANREVAFLLEFV